MIYEEFCSEFLRKLEEKKQDLGYNEIKYYKDGFTSKEPDELTIIRDTNIRYNKIESDVLIGDYIILTLEGKYCQTCRFECRYFYDSYNKDGWEGVWIIVNSNLAVCKRKDVANIMELFDKAEYALLKEKIFIRPLNYADHRYELKNNIYRRIGDIVLVLYILVNDELTGSRHNVMSVKLPKNMVEGWDLPENEIWGNAMTNTYIMAPPRIFINPLDTYKAPYHKGAFMALNSDIKSLSEASVPTVTTTTQMNGAIAMFYPGVKERIAELFGDSYYVAFTSVHDAKLHKKGTIPPIHILRSLKDTNNAFDPADILSRKVYLYETASKEFKQLEL